MNNAASTNADARRRLAYVRPSASFVELEPEERLMSCAKTPSDLVCDDPIGSGFNAS